MLWFVFECVDDVSVVLYIWEACYLSIKKTINMIHTINWKEQTLTRMAFALMILGALVLIISVGLFIKGQSVDSTSSINTTRFGEFGAFISGVVGVLWSLVGILLFFVTLQYQRKELSLQRKELRLTREEFKKTAEANMQIAEDTKANAIVDLYQTYTNDYFFRLSGSAWGILMRCLKNKDYSDYVVSTFFVSEYCAMLSDDTKKIIFSAYAEEITNDSEEEKARILKKDNEERHRLDDFINFLSVLALRNAPKEVFEKCDFFYDWWRPLLWWISDKRHAAYLVDLKKQKYSSKPHHLEILSKLDSIYGFETLESHKERWKYFVDHPLVKKNKFDKRHRNPYL